MVCELRDIADELSWELRHTTRSRWRVCAGLYSARHTACGTCASAIGEPGSLMRGARLG